MHSCVCARVHLHVLPSSPPLHSCMHSPQNKTNNSQNSVHAISHAPQLILQPRKARLGEDTGPIQEHVVSKGQNWSVVKIRWPTNPACCQFPNPGVSCPSEELAEGLAPESAVISCCLSGLCELRFLCSEVSHGCSESIVTFSRRRSKA